jgi:hypothetical protein
VLCAGGFEGAIAPSPSKTARFNQLAVNGRLMKADFQPRSDAILFFCDLFLYRSIAHLGL